MIKYPFFVSIFILMVANHNRVYCQYDHKKEWNLILHQLDSLPQGQDLVEKYIDAGYYRYDYFGDSVLPYAHNAIQISREINYLKGHISALVLKGSFLNSQNQFEKAKVCYLEAIKLNKTLDNPLREAQIRDNLANIYSRQGLFDSAIEIKFQAIEIFQTYNDTAALATGYAGLGSLYSLKNDYEKTVFYCKKALAYDRTTRRAYTLGNIGVAMKNLGEIDSAIFYYRLANESAPDHTMFVGRNYMNMALLYLHATKFDSTEIFFNKARHQFKKAGAIYEQAILSVNQAESELRQRHFQNARQHCLAAEAILDDKGTTKDRRRLSAIMAQLYDSLGNFKESIKYLKDFHRLDDSLSNIALETRVKEIETKYAISEKEKQILSQQVSLAKSERQKNNIILGLLALFVVSFSIIYLLIQRARIRKFKTNQEMLVREKKIEHLRMQNKVATMAAMLKGQESERVRIAKDLHDGIGGLLATAKLQVSSLSHIDMPSSSLHVHQKTAKLLDHAADEVRRIAHNMMPEALSNLGLQHALEDLRDSLRNEGLQVHMEILNLNNRLPENVEVNVYRIIQELVNNLIKHAEASRVIIQLALQGQELQLTVEDNGKGFDPGKQVDGIGLKNIRSRVEYLHGEVDVNTSPGTGTSVSINLPLT